jgi:ATP-dependent Clp protease ATP-binding subunit ClpC
MVEKKLQHCSFCGNHKDEVTKLIVGEDVAICSKCIDLCNQLIVEDGSPKNNKKQEEEAIVDPYSIKAHLDNLVIGQDDAVSKIARAIQRNRVGLNDPKKPIFSGLLIGNSGVGKTELAKQLAKHMFNSEDALIRLDMSEFSDKVATSKLTGTSPGYVGYEDGSPFLNKIKNKPYSVILLDEIEKAHPEIFNVFLQMLDEGFLTDGHGRKINFKNCIILMTSNVGTRVVQQFGTGVGFSTSTKVEHKEEEIKSVLEKELFKKFVPEFINRFDEIIYFKDLDEEKKDIYGER